MESPPHGRLYSHEDPYKTLEVPRNASPSDIKAAYKRLALKYHPDKNYNSPDAQANSAKFVEINWAYSVLSNPKKRKIYDSLGIVGIHTLEQSGDEYLDLLYWASGFWFKCLFLSLCCMTCNFCCLCCYCCCNCCCGQCGPDLTQPRSPEDVNDS